MALIEVTDGIEGGSIPDEFTVRSGDEIYLRKDGGHFYFHLRATNKGDKEATLEVSCEWEPTEQQAWLHPQVRQEGKWESIEIEESIEVRGGRAYVSFSVPLGPGETVLLANTPWIPYSEMMGWMKGVAEANPGICSLENAGRSPEGRDIVYLRFGEGGAEGKGKVLVSGTPQAAEAGEIPCKGAIEYLLAGDGIASRLREDFIIDVLPMPNPDGEVSGSQENPLFTMRDAMEGRADADPNSLLMWKWVSERRPTLFLEFHSETRLKEEGRFNRVYALDSGVYPSEEIGRKASAVADALAGLPGGGCRTDMARGSSWRATLVYLLAEQFGTIGFMYAVHNRYGYGGNLKRGEEALRAMMEAYMGL